MGLILFMDTTLSNLISFFPLILSKDPWEMPTVNIKNRQMIKKLLFIKKPKAESIIEKLKKINEW